MNMIMMLSTLLSSLALISQRAYAENNIVSSSSSLLRASSSSSHRNLMVPLSNCATDCITMPLMVGYQDSCDDTTCKLDAMQEIGIDKTKFRHLAGIGITLVDEISDEELELLQNNDKIKFIECDSCVVSMEDKPICGSNNVTYSNAEEFNCGLKCRDSDSSLSLAYEGPCKAGGGSAVQSVDDTSISSNNDSSDSDLIPLGGCNEDCIAMPFIMTFVADCDNVCATEVMKGAGIDKISYDHLMSSNMILLREVTDDQLMTLRSAAGIVNTIECDSCVYAADWDTVKPVCSSSNVTFANEAEFNCGLQCRGADQSMTIAYEGACIPSATQSVQEDEDKEEEVSVFCTYAKPLTDRCAFEGTCQFNPRSCLGETDSDKIVFDTCECRDGIFDCNEVDLECNDDDIDPSSSCPSEMPIPNSECTTEDLQCNYNPFGCPEREEKNNNGKPYGIWLEQCTCEGGSWLCAAFDIACPRGEPENNNGIDSTLEDDVCGSPTDDCMNDKNYQECMDLKKSGCTSIQLLESCPLQFACAEGAEEPKPVLEGDGGDNGIISGTVEEIPLGNCDADCMTMPLIITFTEECDVSCAAEKMKASGIEKTNYRHLANLNFILLDEVTDDQLTALRRSDDINSIECDSCDVGIEEAHVCGSDGFTYKNEDDLNCELKCRGVDKGITLAYYGVCQSEEDESIAAKPVPLGNCDADCMTMPLMITFKDTCNTDCAVETMNAANIEAKYYEHLLSVNIILLKEVTDEELAALQNRGEFISSIECDSCVSIADVNQVCGTNGVTYKNEEELECGLKCRGADETVKVASDGACTPGFDELISLACDKDCMRMPLLIGFDKECDSNCAIETMQRANIPNSNYDHLTALNIILLNTVTDDQLMVLRGEQDDISFIECDACVSIDGEDSPICADNGITFRSAEELTCENQCRETTTEISISYRGPCEDDSTTPPTDGGGLPALCFSAQGRVQLSNGEMKQMHQLQLGDKVLTQDEKYETVYSWSHYNSDKDAHFIQLLPSRIELSPNHLIFLGTSDTPVPASTIKAGDVLSSGEMVTSVRTVKRRGVYAPFTHSGTIIVNGQAASTFVSLQEKSSVLLLGLWSTGISHQWLARTFEIPHRLWCSFGENCTNESFTPDGISTWVATPLRFFTWSLELPIIFQAMLYLPILALFGMLATIEFAIKNCVVITATTSCIFLGLSVYSSCQLQLRQKTAKTAKIVFV